MAARTFYLLDTLAAMRTRTLELLRLEAERKRREGETLQDIGTP